MCGLAGAVRLTNTAPLNNRSDIQHVFLNSFLTSQLRGVHSSGIAGLWEMQPTKAARKKSTGAISYWNVLKGTDGALPLYKDMMGRINRGYQEQKDTYLSPTIRVLLGHSRHATIGQINEENAHPFYFGRKSMQYKDFIGTHNGTIHNSLEVLEKLESEGVVLKKTSPSVKDLYEKEVTDSERIMYCIYRYGIDAVYPLIKGAWAFVWFNTRERTLHFVRNSQRPFCFYYDSVLDSLFYSSEKEMMAFAASRELNWVKPSNFHEPKPHEYRVLDLKNTQRPTAFDKIDWLEDRVLQPFKPPAVYNQGYNNQNKHYYGSRIVWPKSDTKVETRPINEKPIQLHWLDGEDDDEQGKCACLWCNADIEDKASTLPVKELGVVCEECLSDGHIVNELLTYHGAELADDQQWIELWLSFEDNQEKVNVN